MEMHKRDVEPDFNLREWAVKAKLVSRENTHSRRFSASSIRRSFREDINKSFRSNITISSTASSPGYNTLREEIDPSTYSFTAALKALQARSAYSWEFLSPEGFALNSKWNEAEKYICNPLSGQVPLECLSAKTLSGRSLQYSLAAGRITMSAPLIYPSHSRLIHSNNCLPSHENEAPFPIQEKKVGSSMTRDVGTQSTPPDQSCCSSGSPSPAPTPSIEERSIKRDEPEIDDSPTTNLETRMMNFGEKVDVKETRPDDLGTKGEEEELVDMRRKTKQMCMCRQGGCISWRGLWMRRRKREKHKPRKKNNSSMFFHHIKGILNNSAS